MVNIRLMSVFFRLIIGVIVLNFFLSISFKTTSVYADEARDWPMFMKDETHSSFANISITPPLILKWKFKSNGPIYSSPVVSKGKVFFGSSDKIFYAVDIETGKKVWSFKTRGKIIAAAVVKRGIVYFGSKDGFVYCLNAENGKLHWKFDTGSQIVSSPAIGPEFVFVSSKKTMLFALDKKTGKKKYRRKQADNRFKGYYSNPAYWKGVVYLTSKKGEIAAYHGKRGKQVFGATTESAIYSSPVIDDNTFYIASYDKKLYAIDITNNKTKLKWLADLEARIYASPAVSDSIYIGTKKGELFALSKEDGSILWKLEMKGPISSTMAITENNVGFVGCDDGKFYAVDLEEGLEMWSYSTGGAIHTSPAITQGGIFFGSKDGHLYALNTSNE